MLGAGAGAGNGGGGLVGVMTIMAIEIVDIAAVAVAVYSTQVRRAAWKSASSIHWLLWRNHNFVSLCEKLSVKRVSLST